MKPALKQFGPASLQSCGSNIKSRLHIRRLPQSHGTQPSEVIVAVVPAKYIHLCIVVLFRKSLSKDKPVSKA